MLFRSEEIAWRGVGLGIGGWEEVGGRFGDRMRVELVCRTWFGTAARCTGRPSHRRPLERLANPSSTQPPAGFFIDPSLPSRPAVAATTLAALAASSTPSRSGTPASLIARMGLQGRVVESGEGKKAVWEMSAEGRERSLVERKARMVLEARR